MFCPKCGKYIEPGSLFCPECGTKINNSNISPTVQTVKTIETKGFFASLFDFSFSEFITLKLIKFLYILSVIGSALFALAILIKGFTHPTGTGLLFCFFSLLLFLLLVILSRIWLETMIVIFRIAEDVKNIARVKTMYHEQEKNFKIE